MPRFTIDIDDQFSNTLERLAKGGSKADVIRRAVQTYSYLKDKVPDQESSKRVSITNADNGSVVNDVIVP